MAKARRGCRVGISGSYGGPNLGDEAPDAGDLNLPRDAAAGEAQAELLRQGASLGDRFKVRSSILHEAQR